MNETIRREGIFNAPEDEALQDALSSYVETWIRRKAAIQSNVSLTNYEARIEAAATAAFEAHPNIKKLTIIDPDGEVLLTRERDLSMPPEATLFSPEISRETLHAYSSGKKVPLYGITAQLSALYDFVPPPNLAGLKDLTIRTRWVTAGVAAGLLLLYGALLRWLLLPIRSITMALDKGAQLEAPMVPRARTLLLKYYNNLARDANLALFSRRLREFVSEKALLEAEPLLRLVPGEIRLIFPVGQVDLYSFRRDQDDNSWVFDSVFTVPAGRPESPEVRSLLERRLADHARPLEPPSAKGQDAPENLDPAHRLAIFTAGRTDDALRILVVHPATKSQDTIAWTNDVASRLAAEIDYALNLVSSQRRLVLQEKSKANISLSRNLGHDLTNIIATSKLDLMAIKTFLTLSPEDLRRSPEKEAIFRESLASLLGNTRFLQEIVNLYRSFTYLSRPKYEMVLLRDLVNDVTDLFKLSLSKSFEIHTRHEEGLEPLSVEPRLLRLALFNLLSNAAESIKRATSYDRPSGVIELSTSRGDRPGTQLIVVRDTGTGILGPDGKLLEPGEIEEIFRLGYSTKQQDEGEGLGLHWVQQIIREFHGGAIHPQNSPDGGALFRIHLPEHRPVAASDRTPNGAVLSAPAKDSR